MESLVKVMTQKGSTEAEFDHYRDTYNDRVNESIAFSGLKVDFFTRAKAAYLHDALDKHFPNPAALKVLDVGCGVGNYHQFLRGRIASLSGVDVSRECVDRAKDQNPDVTYKVSDSAELPFADGTFDCAFTICVLHHVAPVNRKIFASEFRRVIRRGGLGLIFEHNPNNPLTRRVVSNCEFDHHAILLKAAESERLLTESGFSAVKTRFLFSIPAANRMLRIVDAWMSPFRLGAQYLTSGSAPH